MGERTADLNGDGAEDIIWVDKGNPHEGGKRIVAVFYGGETNEFTVEEYELYYGMFKEALGDR